MPLPQYLRLSELRQRLGIARSTVYKLIKEEGFPQPFKITRRVSAWNEDEVQDYLMQQRSCSSTVADAGSGTNRAPANEPGAY